MQGPQPASGKTHAATRDNAKESCALQLRLWRVPGAANGLS